MPAGEELRALVRGASTTLAAIRAPAWLGPFGRQPWVVLVPLLLVQWIAVLALALTVRHNGWLYYQGGDQTYYYTTSWLLGSWTLPPTPIGYAWSYLITPISTAAGPSYLDALPGIVLLNTLLLLPVALLCVYGIASRIGGRVFGYWAATLWIAVPYVAIPLFDQRYHAKWVEQTLPQTLGFSGLADFPSMVCVLLAAYLCVRVLDTRSWRDALLLGLTAGFALGLKPANALFLAGPVLAFAIGRRWRELGVFAVGLVPAVVLLLVWKQRGLGQLPAFESSPGGTSLAAVVPLGLANPFDKYFHLDWGVLRQNLDVLREFFWSVRPLEVIPFVGALAIARRSWPKAALVFFWFMAYLLVKGTDPHARVEDASFWRLLMPSFPAYLLLLAAIPLLIPRFAPALARRFPPGELRRRFSRRTFAAVGALSVVLPLIFVVGPSRQTEPVAVTYPDQGVFVPVESFRVEADAAGRSAHLSWAPPTSAGAATFYRILRSPATQDDPDSSDNPPLIDGVNCETHDVTGARPCRVLMATVGTTAATTFEDRPSPGTWSYRIGVSANWANDPTLGDVLLLSAPVRVRIP
jgi:hypothetical protein